MSRSGRRSVFVLTLVVVLFAGVTATALAAEEEVPEDDMPVEEAEEEDAPAESGITPAVEVGTDEAAPAEVDWTYRYMIPTGLALAVVIVLLTSIKYFTDVVRKRYRIVE